MKKTLNHTDMQNLEVAELEAVSGGFGPRTGGGRGFTHGITLPERPESFGGGLSTGGGFPLGTPSEMELSAEMASDLIGG